MSRMRLVIAGVGVLIMLALGAGAFLGVRVLRDATSEAVDLPTWAEHMCGADLVYAEAIFGIIDGVDPGRLEMDVRKERARRISRVQIDAATQRAETLKAITPPEPARVLHEAMIRASEDEADATREQLEAVERATTSQQIAVANSNARFRRDSAAQELDAAFAGVGQDVRDAIANAQKCNETPVPAEPGGLPAFPTPVAARSVPVSAQGS
jgi:hypothetical protein